MIVGAGIFALVGAVGLGRRGVERLRERYR
jgi:hypothetical protein